ncbi:Protein yippee-like [Pleurotus pulmonarius]
MSNSDADATKNSMCNPIHLRIGPLLRARRYICSPLIATAVLVSCRSCITSVDVILPQAAIPNSRGFKGFAGKASLFSEVYHVTLSKPGVHLMSTGAHTMQEIVCSTCDAYLGWKIVKAHNRSERWKEGYNMLELEKLHGGKVEAQLVQAALRPRIRSDSDSDDSN